MLKGKLKFFNQKSKFGFICDSTSSEEFYFRISDLNITKSQFENLSNLVFNFELEESKRGPKAVNITPLSSES